MVNKCGVFHQEVFALLQQQVLCDVTIMVDSGGKLMAHSCMLAASSAVFKQILCSQPITMTIYQPGVSLSTWKLLLEFIYKGDINLHTLSQSQDIAQALYIAATMWDVAELKLLLTDSSVYPSLPHPTTPALSQTPEVVYNNRRDFSTQTDPVTSDKRGDTPPLFGKEKHHNCRYCSFTCGSRLDVIEHVYGSCVKIHSNLKKQSKKSLSTSEYTKQQKPCKLKRKNPCETMDIKELRSEDVEGMSGCSDVNDDDTVTSNRDTAETGIQEALKWDSATSCLVTGDLERGNCHQMTSCASQLTMPKDVLTVTVIGSMDKKLSEKHSEQVVKRRSSLDKSRSLEVKSRSPVVKSRSPAAKSRSPVIMSLENRPLSIDTKVPESLRKTELLLRSVRTQNEEFKSSHTEQMEGYNRETSQFEQKEHLKTGQTPHNIHDLKTSVKENVDVKTGCVNQQQVSQDFLLVESRTTLSQRSVTVGKRSRMGKVREKQQENLFVCLDWNCRARFTKLREYTSHLRHCLTGGDYVDPEKFLHKKGNTFTLKDEKNPPLSGGLQCPSFHLMDVHCQTHKRKKTKQYSCDHCVHTEVGLRRMLSHVTNVHCKVKPYKCWRCQQRFFGFQEIKDHVLRFHSNKRAFSCRDCSAKFSCKATLRSHCLQEHQQTNDKGKPRRRYKCSRCNKSFKLQHQCRRHEMTHKCHENRVHACHVCGKRFITRSCLRSHLHIHTGVKPFRCPKCPYKARRRSHLQLHMRTHGLQIVAHSCASCGGKFTLKTKLEEHLRKLGHVAQRMAGDMMYETVQRTDVCTRPGHTLKSQISTLCTADQPKVSNSMNTATLTSMCYSTIQPAKAGRSLNVQVKASRPLDSQFEAGRSMDVHVIASRSLDAQFEVSRSLNVQFEASRPLDAQFEASRPLDAQFEASRPLVAECKASRPLVAQCKASRPLDAQFEASKPLNVQFETSGPLDVQFEASRNLDVQFEASRPLNVQFEASRPLDIQVNTSRDPRILDETLGQYNIRRELGPSLSSKPFKDTGSSGHNIPAGISFHQTNICTNVSGGIAPAAMHRTNFAGKHSHKVSSSDPRINTVLHQGEPSLFRGDGVDIGTSIYKKNVRSDHQVLSSSSKNLFPLSGPGGSSCLNVPDNRYSLIGSSLHLLSDVSVLQQVSTSSSTTSSSSSSGRSFSLLPPPQSGKSTLVHYLPKTTTTSEQSPVSTSSSTTSSSSSSGRPFSPPAPPRSAKSTLVHYLPETTTTSERSQVCTTSSSSSSGRPFSASVPLLSAKSTLVHYLPKTITTSERGVHHLQKEFKAPTITSPAVAATSTSLHHFRECSSGSFHQLSYHNSTSLRLSTAATNKSSTPTVVDRYPQNNALISSSQQPFSSSQLLLQTTSCNTNMPPPPTVTQLQQKLPYETMYRSLLDQPPPEVIPKVVLQYPGQQVDNSKTNLTGNQNVRGNLIGCQPDNRAPYNQVKQLPIGRQPDVRASHGTSGQPKPQ